MACDTLEKYASEVCDFQMDFASYPEFNESPPQTISGTPTVAFTPSGPTANTPSVSGTVVQFQVSGGTGGQSYAVRVTISTSGGKTRIGEGTLSVLA